MRELAEEAGVSFATPFNQFGSKAAIMPALTARRVALMQGRFAQAARPDTATARVLLAVTIDASVMLAAPAVNGAVTAAIGAPSDEASDVAYRSHAEPKRRTTSTYQLNGKVLEDTHFSCDQL